MSSLETSSRNLYHNGNLDIIMANFTTKDVLELNIFEDIYYYCVTALKFFRLELVNEILRTYDDSILTNFVLLELDMKEKNKTVMKNFMVILDSINLLEVSNFDEGIKYFDNYYIQKFCDEDMKYILSFLFWLYSNSNSRSCNSYLDNRIYKLIECIKSYGSKKDNLGFKNSKSDLFLNLSEIINLLGYRKISKILIDEYCEENHSTQKTICEQADDLICEGGDYISFYKKWNLHIHENLLTKFLWDFSYVKFLYFTDRIKLFREKSMTLSSYGIKNFTIQHIKFLNKLKSIVDLVTDYIVECNFNIIYAHNLESCKLPEERYYVNEEGFAECSICSDKIISGEITLAHCINCDKYIGHLTCVYKKIKYNKVCPLCRQM